MTEPEFFISHHETIPNYVQHPDTESVNSGPWHAADTWSNGAPTADTDARINAGHHVLITAPTGSPGRRVGDLDGDGEVGVSDYLIWRETKGQKKDLRADANKDGRVNNQDLFLFLDDWAGLIPVPDGDPGEPTGNALAAVRNLNVYGKLSLAPSADTKLEVSTLTILGELEIGTEDQPITATAEVVFRGAAIDTEFDPQQFGVGLLAHSGTITVHGRERTPYLRLDSPALAGQTEIVLTSAPVNWLPGDELFLPDTSYIHADNIGRFSLLEYDEAEIAVIASVNGSVVGLAAPLVHDHNAAEGWDGAIVGRYLPHAAHLSGNVTFRSADPKGVRGHILIADRVHAVIRDAVFRDLGRTTVEQLDNTHLGPGREVRHVGTNQVGRYALHLHHVYGPLGLELDYQFEVSGNVIRDGRKWGLAVHDSHFGLVSDNVIYNMQGAGVVMEDGSEFGNEISHNFVGLVLGSGLGIQGRANGQESVLVGNGTPGNPFRTEGDTGHEGAGIWARGASNHFIRNVVANARFANVMWARFQEPERLPAFQGASTHHDFVLSPIGLQHGHRFDGNEAYSTVFAYSWQGIAQLEGAEFSVEDIIAWNAVIGLDTSYTGPIRVRKGYLQGQSAGIRNGFTASIDLDNVAVEHFWVGMNIPIHGRVANSHFACLFSDITILQLSNSVIQTTIPIHNTTFHDNKNNIVWEWGESRVPGVTYVVPADILVTSYNGGAGDDFQVHSPKQAPDYEMAFGDDPRGPSHYQRFSPFPGLSNQELWDRYLISAAGRLLPAGARERMGIVGVVAPIPDDLASPVIANATVEATGTTATIRFRTDKPCRAQIEYRKEFRIQVGSYATLRPASTEYVTEHEFTITDLEPGKHVYIIRAYDAAANFGLYADVSPGEYYGPTFTVGAS